MDILAHGVYNLALQKTIKKDSKTKRELVEAFAWGIMPDLLAFGIPLLFAIFAGSLDHHAVVGGFDISKAIYPFTHSLVIFAGAFLLISLITKRWYLPMLGWGFHVLLDIPLHTPDFFPTPFLFPVSSYTFPFGIYWGTPVIWIGIWVVAIVWMIAVFYKRTNKSEKTNI